MIAFSTLRPFGSDPEYDRNQLAAWQSWQNAFSLIVYLNDPQPQLANEKTLFIPSEPFPKIWKICEYMAYQKEMCCIINGDIIISGQWNRVVSALNSRHALSAVSCRYEFDPEVGLEPNRIMDCGIDFFCAMPEVWSIASNLADEKLRLGVGWFDTWLMGCFTSFSMSGLYDLTPCKVIYHPKHGGRKYGPGFNHLDIPMVGSAAMPSAKLFL
jgi:hypothetical protein